MGTSAMAQMRQFAAAGDRTSGCIGHQKTSGRSVSRTISTIAPDWSRNHARSSLTDTGVAPSAAITVPGIVGSEGHVGEHGVRNRPRDGGVRE